MKKTMIYAVLILAVLGCTGPYSPDGSIADQLGGILGDLGGIRILGVAGSSPSGESLFTAQTALPDIAFDDIKALRITLEEGPAGTSPLTIIVADPAFDANGNLESALEITDIVPGEWTLRVEALDANPDPGPAGVLLRGTASVSVTAGEFFELATVTVDLVDDEGDGFWALTIDWPQENSPSYPITDVVDTVAWRVGEGEWETVAAEDQAAGGVYSQAFGSLLAPGDHLISLELRAGDKPQPYNTVARYDEIWRISSNVTTRKTVSFVEADFAYGGGARFNITIDLPEDLEAFFADAPDSTVPGGESYEINAATIQGATYYWWRVDGEEVSDGVDTTTLTIDTAEGDAGTVLLVVLVVEVNGRLYSGSHRVRVEAPTP